MAELDLTPAIEAAQRAHQTHRIVFGASFNAPWHCACGAIGPDIATHKLTVGIKATVEVLRIEEMRAVLKAARALLALKDGPRDEAYEAAKAGAWQALRDAVSRVGTDTTGGIHGYQ